MDQSDSAHFSYETVSGAGAGGGMIVHGRCHCGEITFEAEVDPEEVFVCHGEDSRVLSSSAFLTVVPCRRNAFFPLAGTPRFYIMKAEGGGRRALAFCGTCGTAIHSTDADDRGADFILRTGILVEAATLSPRHQTCTESALPWLGTIPGLPGRSRS
ncbi:MAG: GFA family protein [Pseudomonadota bacterium]